jgi:lysophospholipase L1-like esterase
MNGSHTKYVWVVVFLVIISAIYTLKHPGAIPVKNLDSQGSAIVAFGDSLVQGVGSSPGKNFVSLLSKDLGLKIINMGHSGDTTAAALERVDEVIAMNPKIVLVLLGGNDYIQKVPHAETFNNLSEIINRIQDAGSAVLLIGVRGGILSDSFKGQYKELAEKHKTAFVPDIMDGLIGTRTYMSDLVHPNDAGYRVVADKIEPVLRRMMEF